MVASAQQDEIVETGGPSIGPVLYVMSVAPPPRRSAACDDAPTISGRERFSDAAAHDSGRPADIEHLRLAGGDDPCDLGVAGELPGGPGCDHARVVELHANGTIRVRERARRTYYTTTASAIFWEGAKADAGFSGKPPRGLARRDPLPRKAEA